MKSTFRVPHTFKKLFASLSFAIMMLANTAIFASEKKGFKTDSLFRDFKRLLHQSSKSGSYLKMVMHPLSDEANNIKTKSPEAYRHGLFNTFTDFIVQCIAQFSINKFGS